MNVHGAIFSAWAILLLGQTSLAKAGRIDLHRRLGLAGFGLACLVVLAGVAVVCEQSAGFIARATRTLPVLPKSSASWVSRCWPIFIAGNFILALACCYSLLALMAFYDWRSTGKVQLATLLGSATVIATNPPISAAFAHNAVWVYVATQMLALGHFLR